ncbi:Oidioi.mRNA.OKI2018_I69.PAR.g10393.t1.cds [Oikopleura dioica]|uniref:Oidioi.mRNA.OKI2018_I69.PAR.g10393.t1.cds n=1 Tax=Oikopleura dioica TaxID=34765 RepID=A0ABN7RTU9_OIKDI|nr:Oidioi.mRNA.OKI2018_I69.PAR.g10393.t1.cds [Oikopleura dioica]
MEQFNLESSAAIKAKYAQVQEKILETFVSMAKVTKKLNESSAEVKCERFNSDSTFSNKFWGVITNQRQTVFAKTWESVQHSGGNDPNKAVNAIMADPDRLLRRSRLRKSFTARRLGVEENDAEQDEEHYDDTGLYQSILRNLINSKANSTDPNNTTELNKHWLKLQRLEKKTKKVNVDTKASKGRKIRYNVHQKLVGFFPKADKAEWTHERRNQLFRGVFQF